jgi:hypothetical protein
MGNSSSTPTEKSKPYFSFFSSSKPETKEASPIFGSEAKPPATSSFFSGTTAPAQATTPAPATSSFFGNSTPAQTPAIGGRTRRKKRSTKKNKTKGRINFSKIKWGSFTKIYNNYIKNHPNMITQLPDLKHFAHYVNKHPTQFTKKTHKKALFYTNIIEK